MRTQIEKRVSEKKKSKIVLLLTLSDLCIWKSTKFSSTVILPARHHWLAVSCLNFRFRCFSPFDIPFAHFVGWIWHTIHLLLHSRAIILFIRLSGICCILKSIHIARYCDSFFHNFYFFAHFSSISYSCSVLHIFYYGVIASCTDNAFANQFRTQCSTY